MMPEGAEVTDPAAHGLARRDALRGGAVVGAAIWLSPVVQVVGIGKASAQTPSGGPPSTPTTSVEPTTSPSTEPSGTGSPRPTQTASVEPTKLPNPTEPGRNGDRGVLGTKLPPTGAAVAGVAAVGVAAVATGAALRHGARDRAQGEQAGSAQSP